MPCCLLVLLVLSSIAQSAVSVKGVQRAPPPLCPPVSSTLERSLPSGCSRSILIDGTTRVRILALLFDTPSIPHSVADGVSSSRFCAETSAPSVRILSKQK